MKRLIGFAFASFYLISGLNAQNNELGFEEIVEVVTNNPDSVFLLAEEDKLPKKLTEKQRLYIHALAAESIGEYTATDSLIKHAFSNYSFKSDSMFYMRFLELLAEQRKITDDFESSVKLNYQILAYFDKINDTVNIIRSHTAFGELYRAMENFPLSESYLDKGEKILLASSKPISKKVYCGLLNRRAAIFMQQGIYLDSVEKLSLKVINMAKEIGDLDLEASSCNEVAYLYLNRKDKNAEKYLLRAIKIWDDLGYDIYAANARLNLSRHYDHLKEHQKALEVLEYIIPLVENSDWNWEKGSFYDMLGKVNANMGNYKEAFIYTEKAKDKLLLVYAKQYYEKLAVLSQELEVQKKEREIQEKEILIEEAKNEKEQVKGERQTLYTILVVLTVFVIILFALVYFINNQKSVLKRQQTLIRKTNENLNKEIETNKVLIKEVNHRVKNNLSILTGLLYLQQKELKSEEAIAALKDSQLRIKTIALIHESLYQREDTDRVDFQDYLHRLSNYISSIYWDNTNKVEFKINCQEFTPNLSTSIPLGMILNEFITNSFKYAFKDIEHPKIFINYSKEKNQLCYSDNGPGIKQKPKKKSLGLKLVELFCQQIGAEHKAEFKGNEFTQIIILS